MRLVSRKETVAENRMTSETAGIMIVKRKKKSTHQLIVLIDVILSQNIKVTARGSVSME